MSTASTPSTPARQSALAQRAAELRKRLDSDFFVRSEWPFVVAGNLDRDDLDRFFQSTLLDSYRCLRRDYFTSEPSRPITVFLFKDDADYRRYARELLGDTPSTPYGYFSPRHEALVMNIATGGGTLVHELCHPLIDRDFPACPTWFNEGLASLHEQCTRRGDSLAGLPNWRLPDLQKAIRAGKALALADVVEKTDHAKFYEQDKGLNYATARYLCLYLQENGQLKDFYARFKAAAAHDPGRDPTGRKTLESLLGKTLPALDPEWQRWVLTLRFPE